MFTSVNALSGSGITNVNEDTSPELGGNLDVVTHQIVSTSGRDIEIIPAVSYTHLRAHET